MDEAAAPGLAWPTPDGPQTRGVEHPLDPQAAVAAIVERGVRTGAEFRAVRKALGMPAIAVAKLFGVTPETVSRWEHGSHAIPRTTAFALGELYLQPQLTRHKLRGLDV